MLEQAFLVSTFILLLGCPVNVLLIWVLMSVKRLRTFHNRLIVNNVLPDTIVTGFLLPLCIIVEFGVPGNIRIVCCFFFYICLTASCISSLILAVERYMTIYKNVCFDDHLTLNKLLGLGAFAFAIGVMISTPLSLNEEFAKSNSSVADCFFSSSYGSAHLVLHYLWIVVCCIIPLFVTGVFYINIYRFKFTSLRVRTKWSVWNIQNDQQEYRKKMDVVRSNFVVYLITLVVCTFFILISLMSSDKSDAVNMMKKISILMILLKSALISVIYLALNASIRKSYKSALRRDSKDILLSGNFGDDNKLSGYLPSVTDAVASGATATNNEEIIDLESISIV